MPSADAAVTLWHKPNCSTSLAALAMLKERGIRPALFLYLEEKPDARALRAILRKLNLPPSGLLRRKEPLAEELGLLDRDAAEDDILAAMAAHPILIERPIVVTLSAAVIARPLERMDEVLAPS
jgi:arsenate reductase